MHSKIWITGYGIVSAIGVGKEETLASILESRSGIAPLRYLNTTHHEFPVGEVKLTNEEMCQRLSITSNQPVNRTALMGMMALEEALQHAHLPHNNLSSVALVSGTTVGGMDMSEQFYLDYINNDSRNDYIKIHDCGATTELMADHIGRFGSITTLSTACSSAANAILLGANMLRGGEAQCAVVGGSECLTKFHLNGFNSLMILDTHLCRPFDRYRAGLNLGEGAAFLVLETEEHARSRGVQPLAALSGYGNACDAFHQTASSPKGEGAFRAMSAALQMAGLTPDAIDYVNAHGTATPNNDSSESAAMRRLWSKHLPAISSTKSFTGHTTSASGAIEAVICLLAMQHRFLPPNLNFGTPDPDCIIPVQHLEKEVSLNHILCNSFGFGGNDTSFILSLPKVATSIPFPDRATPIYLFSTASINAQGFQYPCPSQTSHCERDMGEPLTSPFQRASDPDFKLYFSPLESRRMGRLLKRAIITSQKSLEKAHITQPDAIITGTGLGCIENTEYFLDSLCRDGEQLLKPTYFMQSTHNTIGSVVATRLKCHAYNVTYAHKETSFDSALHDALLQIGLGDIRSALVGAHDELTPSYYALLVKAGFLKGVPACEASTSFLLASKDSVSAQPICRLWGMKMHYHPTDDEIILSVEKMLSATPFTALSAIMVSTNGNPLHDTLILDCCKRNFPDIPLIPYKHIFGESYAASGVGLHVAAIQIANGIIKEPLLLLNYTDGNCCTLTLLSK